MFRHRMLGVARTLIILAIVVALCVVSCWQVLASTSTPMDCAIEFLRNQYLQNGFASNEQGVGSYAAALLAQAGASIEGEDWKREGKTLKQAVEEAIAADLQGQELPAKRLGQHLLAAKMLGLDSTHLVEKLKQMEKEQGGFDGNLFSDVPAYDLLARAGYLGQFSHARDYLISSQAQDGSWGTTWGDSYFADFMTTAQAVRVLLALKSGEDQPLASAIQRGLDYLKSKQQADGSFALSSWDDPLIDTVEVIATLRVAGIDPRSWKAASGKSGVDYVSEKAMNQDGTFGTLGNAMDAIWALWGYQLIGERLTLDPSSLTLEEGKQASVRCYWQSGTTSVDVTEEALWTVADQSVASVTDGTVTGTKAGTTTVGANYRGLEAQAQVTVTAQPSPPSGSSGSPSTVKIKVKVAVVGKYGELLCPPRSVTLSDKDKWGFSAMGALDAIGLPYTLSDKWEGFVEAIAGQRNEGYSGWCYTVNGTMPAVLAKDCHLDAGDRVIWYYSTDMSTPIPRWEELLRKQAAGIISVEDAVANTVEKAVNGLKAGSLTPAQAVKSVLDSLQGITKASKALKGSLLEVAELLRREVSSIPENALRVEETPTSYRIALSHTSVGEFVKLYKDVKSLLSRLQELGVVDQGGSQTSVTLLAPAGRSQVELVLSRAATEKLIQEGLVLELKAESFCVRLPKEYLETQIASSSQEQSLWLGTSMDPGDLLQGMSLLHQGVLTLRGSVPLDGVALWFVLPSALADHGELSIYYFDGNDWEYVGGKLEPEGRLSCSVKGEGTYLVARFHPEFRDMEEHWAKDSVDLLARRLIVKGIGESRFAPDEKLTRAQFAALLARAMGLKGHSSSVFADVPEDHWASSAVGSLSQSGLISGTKPGLFEPERYISREEMAVAFARALELAGIGPSLGEGQVDSLLGVYRDSAQVAPWARRALASCMVSGIMQGRPGLEIAPKDMASRAEAVTMVKNLLQRLGRL
ncbi:MAG: S-layer homology domain-containing protein [Bacillota bacterium]